MKKRILLTILFAISFGLLSQAQNETINGQLYLKDFLQLNGTNAQVIHLRPNAGHGSYIYWAENGIAERGILGFDAGSGDFVYKSGAHNFTNGAERFRITSTGNIGIGTSTPDQRLVVNGQISFDYGDSKSYNGFRKTGLKTEYYNLITTRDLVIHEFTGSNGAIMSLKNNGYVGIGTTTPDQRLVVNGQISFDYGDGKSYNGFRKTGPKTEYYNLITTRDLVIHEFTGSNGAIMSLKNNGYVGIGTTTPDMKLTVKGNIHAEEVKIDLSVPAPDYVFKKEYKLRSIEEVEKYIIKNNHLPEIPSAKEFEKNGIMQAEMDMNLLKKIEELTLYTIQQQKDIKLQKIKLEKQGKDISKLKSLVLKLLESKN